MQYKTDANVSTGLLELSLTRATALRFALAWLAVGLLPGCGFKTRWGRALEHFVAGQLAVERQEYDRALA
jgi:enoyl-CoA hydratase/carnithine racemase